MNKLVINRLFESFRELETAIRTARVTLETKEEQPAEMLKRISSYEEILEKQKNLATTMCGHVSLGNWDEVARHIKLINGLSSMIRDDARELLGTPPVVEGEEPREVLYS